MKKGRCIFDVISLFFAKFLAGLFTVLPQGISERIAYWLIRFSFLFIPRFKKVALRNLLIVFPEKSFSEHLKIYYGSLRTLANNFVCFARIPNLTIEKVKETVDFSQGEPIIRKAIEDSNGKGIVLTTAHFGSFEFLTQAVTLKIRPLAILARPFKLPLFNKWWCQRRELFGNQVFDRQGGFKEIVGRLRNGQDVGILIDQNVKRANATFIDFLGQQAAVTKGVGLAIMRTGSPVVFGLSIRQAPNFYKVIWKRIVPPENGTLDEKINSILKQAHDMLADFIREYPDQWLWIHRRFKTKPEGILEDTYSNL